jgi:vacuolar-type H+-ATPase subunit H
MEASAMGATGLRVEKSYGEEAREAVDIGREAAYEDQVPLSAYEISLFIDEIEDLVCSGFSVPFTSKAIIDREQCLSGLHVLRTNLPWEMLEAKRILSEQEEVLERAEEEAEEIRQLAERQAAFILDQSQLMKAAEARVQEMIEIAERESTEMMDAAGRESAELVRMAEQDARDLYQGLGRELELLLRDVMELVAARLGKLSD